MDLEHKAMERLKTASEMSLHHYGQPLVCTYMDRLTSNKEVSEMGMYELAHNACYAKDGTARYRDYDTDIDARELAIKLLENYADIPNEFTCDEDFDDFISDFLQYRTDCITGLVAVFYQHIWSMADLRERLKEYEDLEEQGKILKLPCAVGDTVYAFHAFNMAKVVEFKVDKISWFTMDGKDIINVECSNTDCDCFRKFTKEEFGKTVFLTHEAAEAALKELRKE